MKADMIEASKKFRTKTSRLSSKVQAVPFYNFFAFLELSNSLWIGKDHNFKIYDKIKDRKNEIKNYLKIKL